MALSIASKHSLSWNVLLDILQMVNLITGKGVMPQTKHTLKKTLYNINTDKVKCHVYCPECNQYFGNEMKSTKNSKTIVTCSCGAKVDSSISYFMEIDIEDQLKLLLSDEKIIESLKYKSERVKMNVDGLEDIYDGRIYRNLEKERFFENNCNLSYTLNTDGCQPSDSTKLTVWPIYWMINELPPDLRRKNMILTGLWVAKSEPDMTMYLQPLVTQANKLSTQGFSCNLNGETIVRKIAPLSCCVDTPCRAAMLNMKRFNGEYGCTYCEHPAKTVNGVKKYPMINTVPKLRTDRSIKLKMIQALESEKDVTGSYLKYILLAAHVFFHVSCSVTIACSLGKLFFRRSYRACALTS